MLASGYSKDANLVFAVTFSAYDLQVDVSADLVQHEGPNPNKDKILTYEGFNEALFSNGF